MLPFIYYAILCCIHPRTERLWSLICVYFPTHTLKFLENTVFECILLLWMICTHSQDHTVRTKCKRGKHEFTHAYELLLQRIACCRGMREFTYHHLTRRACFASLGSWSKSQDLWFYGWQSAGTHDLRSAGVFPRRIDFHNCTTTKYAHMPAFKTIRKGMPGIIMIGLCCYFVSSFALLQHCQ